MSESGLLFGVAVLRGHPATALTARTASDPGPTLEEMSREECFQLLAVVSIGGVAVARRDDPPLVVPVNYLLDGEVIVFRTDPGTTLFALGEQPISFEVVGVVDPPAASPVAEPAGDEHP